MEAVISGQAGIALLIEDDHFRSVHVEQPDKLVPRRAGEFHWLFGRANDLLFREDTTLEKVREELESAVAGTDALQLALMIFDSNRPNDIRSEAAVELDELLRLVPKGGPYAERLLLSHPLPDETVRNSDAVSIAVGAGRIFLERINQLQISVEQVFSAWRQIPESLFVQGDQVFRDSHEATFVREGIFRDFVTAVDRRTTDSRNTVIDVLAAALQLPAVKSLPNFWAILQEWIQRLPTEDKFAAGRKIEFFALTEKTEKEIREFQLNTQVRKTNVARSKELVRQFTHFEALMSSAS